MIMNKQLENKNYIKPTDSLVIELLNKMGIDIDITRAVKINIEVGRVVTVEVEYFASGDNIRDITQIFKSYKLIEK